MHRFFFHTIWLAQITVGITLFALSCWVEIKVLQNFMESATVATVLAIALEVSKALAIIWNRFLKLEEESV